MRAGVAEYRRSWPLMCKERATLVVFGTQARRDGKRGVFRCNDSSSDSDV